MTLTIVYSFIKGTLLPLPAVFISFSVDKFKYNLNRFPSYLCISSSTWFYSACNSTNRYTTSYWSLHVDNNFVVHPKSMPKIIFYLFNLNNCRNQVFSEKQILQVSVLLRKKLYLSSFLFQFLVFSI